MTPAEAQKLVAAVKTKSSSQPRLRVVGSIDNPDADGPGARLQHARREAALSVVQVAQALKLRPDQIAAIESMQFGRLPGLGYALGYVRAYAELMDISDVKALVEDFKDAWAPQQKRHEQNRHVLSSKLALPIGAMAAIGLIGWAIVGLAVQLSLPKANDSIERPDSAIKAWAQKDVNSSSRPVVDIDALSSIVALRQVHIALRGEDGALVLDRYLRPNESVSTDGLGRFIISTEDAGAIKINGYGLSLIAGDNHQILSNWRSPDLKSAAELKAKAAREAAAIEAAKNAPIVETAVSANVAETGIVGQPTNIAPAANAPIANIAAPTNIAPK